MRLTTLLLIAAFAQVSAKGIAQEKITLELKNAPLEKVFTEIRKITGHDFFYDDAIVKTAKPVTIKVRDASLKEVLDECFKDQVLTYSISGNAITVEPKPKTTTLSTVPTEALIDVKGRIANEKGEAIIGASISVKGTNRGTTTNETGDFFLSAIDENAILQISHVSIEPFEIKVKGRSDLSVISAMNKIIESETVTIIANTGYQEIPRHQSTGSVDIITNRQLNSRPSSDILKRIENWTPGVLFDRRDDKSISVRGRSTIFSNDQPLIVVDNFPYDGDIFNINPNDIESVTILKDAASASIWGVRAGNGVIVITTKKGRYNQEPTVEINTNLTFIDKPHLDQVPVISSADFIEVEKELFSQGYYSSFEANLPFVTYPFSPVVELLIAKRDNIVPASQADAQIEALKNLDVRRDFAKYFYRRGINQQYSVNVRGGTPTYKYYLSAGYDNNLNPLVSVKSDRVSFKSHNTFTPFKNLEIQGGILFTQSKYISGNNPGYGGINVGWGYVLYPYAELADQNGNPLPIIRNHRLSYDLNSQSTGLLDWTYKPIDDIRQTKYNNRASDFTINAGVKYKLLRSLNAEIRYQYERTINSETNLKTKDSYEARDVVNRFTQLSATGELSQVIKTGGIYYSGNGELNSHQFRSTLDFKESWLNKHELAVIAGMEIKDLTLINLTNAPRYEYDEKTGNSNIRYDYLTQYTMFDNQFSQERISTGESFGQRNDRFISYFGNLGYTYLGRYTFSLSGRIDQSNFFGVKANQRKVPLWSTGVLWDVSKETFYDIPWLPKLALRGSFGYNGNINKNVTAFTTAQVFSSVRTQQPYLSILNPPNNELRWEKVRMINAGLDFELGKRPIITGNIQIYWKRGIDLFGYAPLDPTLGFSNSNYQSVFFGNVADMRGQGVDISVTSTNINKKFKWFTDFVFSYSSNEVTKFESTSNNAADYLTSYSTISPLVGKPLFSVLSYRWAGLDPSNGDPQGYVGKDISKDYTAISSQTKLDELKYSGPAIPPYYGSIRNTFSYKGFSLYANITYRFGYYFKRNSISYSALYTNWNGHKDFSQRWQNPGDEINTNVPSMPSLSQLSMSEIANRDAFYLNSEAVVEKGDHIRFEELSLSYEINKQVWKRQPFKAMRVTFYSNNLLIIWRANKKGIDPYYNGIPGAGKSIAFGLNANF